MPIYTYRCESCVLEFDEVAKISDYQKPQACPRCENPSGRIIGDVPPGYVLQGDGWPGKNLRIKGQMERKNERLASKEREMKGDGLVPKLVPNVGGEQTDSWTDAVKLAADKGKDTSGYETYARKEKSGP